MGIGFEFATATRIVFGQGALRQIGSLAKPLGSKALIVTGRDSTRAQNLTSELKSHQVESVIFSVTGEPSVQTIGEGVQFAKHRHSEFVISFGGGSAIDAGKAIAAMLTNEGDLLDYLEDRTVFEYHNGYVAIPANPGLGISIAEDVVRAAAQKGHRWRNPVWRNDDGTIAEW